MTGIGTATAPAPARARARARAHGGADGLWWCSGDWTLEVSDLDPLAPSRSVQGERRRRLVARRAIGRAWARELVREHLDGVWPGFRAHRPGEKPRLRGDQPIDVSIAHSGASMLVAIGRGVLVGADLEAAPFEAFSRPQLVRRMCSPEELARFGRVADGAVRRRALARAWTVKEAVLKARGVGLAVDPRSVAVDVEAILADVEARSADADAASAPEMSIVRLLAESGAGGADGRAVEVVHPRG
ncbi:4'-phosphopantetheinyl transferase superfamily protein [Agromyces sp. PvR057]|uniref:4'-phosphopantetheinyl transferase family protein n=1 Tax=Agromyces sp. PvR057 TaxID=3156403 RepID=UPI003397BE94